MNNDFEKNTHDSSCDNEISKSSQDISQNQNTSDGSSLQQGHKTVIESPEHTLPKEQSENEHMPVFTNDYTDSRPNESNAQPLNHASFTSGTSYKAGNTNGYEWNTAPASDKATHKTKHNRTSGLRVFTSIMLTVFVLSFVTLTAMVATLAIDRNASSDNSKSSNNTEHSSSNLPTPSTNTSSYATITNIPSGSALTVAQIAAKCSPSAVGILSEVDASYSFGFFSQSGTATSVGSGFIYSNDGYIITNHHVVDGAKSITVVLHDKTELEATVVGSDSISDIAVIKIEPTDSITLTPMEIGNSDDLVVGEPVVAIGCPAGIEYMGTVTDGIVSAINRDIEITDNYGRIQKTMTLIQTNATINKGNSGGPLINNRGQVIGINTLKLTSEYEGIGFSIPMNGAMPIINQLIEHGKVIERTEEDFAYGSGQIGISGQAITADEAEYYGIPQGVLVYQINKNSSAAKAGLRRGDIITKYNGQDVKTVDDINNLKTKNRAGETVTVTVYRDSEDGKGTTLDISFKLDAQS